MQFKRKGRPSAFKVWKNHSVRWKGRDKVEVISSPLSFSLHHFREGLGGLHPPQTGQEAMTLGATDSVSVHRASNLAAGVFGRFLVCHEKRQISNIENKSPTADKINTAKLNSINSQNRSYQASVCVSV